MTLVSIIKKKNIYWLSKTTISSRDKKKVVAKQFKEPSHEVVTKEQFISEC
jgi:hypothetical protein